MKDNGLSYHSTLVAVATEMGRIVQESAKKYEPRTWSVAFQLFVDDPVKGMCGEHNYELGWLVIRRSSYKKMCAVIKRIKKETLPKRKPK